jgi:hypothetical protein
MPYIRYLVSLPDINPTRQRYHQNSHEAKTFYMHQ